MPPSIDEFARLDEQEERLASAEAFRPTAFDRRSSGPWRRIGRLMIEQTAMLSGETIHAGILDGHEVVYELCERGPQGMPVEAGQRVPAHLCAAGVVTLSRIGDAALAAWARQHAFVGFTAKSVSDAESFLALTREARLQDYWISLEHLNPRTLSVAVPLTDMLGRCVAAIGATVATQRYLDARSVKGLIHRLHATAHRIGTLL